MQKLGYLGDWEYITKNEYIVIEMQNSARVQIKANSPNPVGLYYLELDKNRKPIKKSEPEFLAKVDGLDEVHFNTDRSIAIVSDGPVAISTDHVKVRHKYEATETFTRIVERRALDPNVEALKARIQTRHIYMKMSEMQQTMLQMQQNQVNNEQTTQSSAAVQTETQRGLAPSTQLGETASTEALLAQESPAETTGAGGQGDGTQAPASG